MIPIVVLYCVLTSLCLWFIIGGKGHWLIKTLTVPMFIGFSICVGITMNTMLGWPTEEELPQEYEVFWIKVDTPNIKTGYKGLITIWCKDLEGNSRKSYSVYTPKDDDTRIHKLPYSKQLHKRANEAIKMLKKGIRVKGSGGGGKGKGAKGKGKGKGKSGKGGDDNDDSVGPKFYVLPPRGLPNKDGDK